MAGLGYGPHITLAVYDNVGERELAAALSATFAGQPPLRLTFAHLAVFEQPQFVVWAAPQRSADLDRLHHAVHSRIPPALCDAHYRPEHWVAHCTLASNVTDHQRPDVRTAVAAGIEPFEAVFETADVVRFPPPTVLASVALD